MEKLLEIARKPTTLIGFAGIVVIVLYGIYTQVLKLPIFSELGQTYTFQTINRVLDWAFVLAILAVLFVGVHTLYKLYIEGKKNAAAATVKLTGNVHFADGNPARGAEVWVLGIDAGTRETNDRGWFELEVPARETWKVCARYANLPPVQKEVARVDAAREIILTLPQNAPPPPSPPGNDPQPQDDSPPRPPTASANALRDAYLKHLLEETRPLPLMGIDPTAVVGPARPELSLAAVYTALLTERPEEREMARPAPQEMAWDRETRRLSALEMLNREKYLALLGAPGSGKSTFVNFVAFCLAGEILGDAEGNLRTLCAPLPNDDEKEARPQSWNYGALLPVRVILRELVARGLPAPSAAVDADTLWRFIVTELGETHRTYAEHLYCELLERGGLILLDGLDEVPDADDRRGQVKQVVQDFVSRFPRCRFLVTTRTYAYQKQDWKLRGFAEATLSPFTATQIAYFVDNWYQHVGAARGMNAADVQGRAAALQTSIRRSARLRELAARPLLLTLMASLHLWHGRDLPEKRQELYEETVKLLLDRWESQRLRRNPDGTFEVQEPSLSEWLNVDRAAVRRELNQLAFEVHRDQPQQETTADISQTRLIAALLNVKGRHHTVNDRELVKYISHRAGLLAARGDKVYAFPHRTFQEYLAACYMTDHVDWDEWAAMLRADPQRWREAVLLAAAKMAGGGGLMIWPIAQALCGETEPPEQDGNAACWGALLAAQTLWENLGGGVRQVAARNAPVRDRIRDWLLAIVTRGWLPPVDRALAGELLAALDDPRDLDEMITIDAEEFLMGSDEDSDAKPHRVHLSTYRIGKYPVTNAQYLEFVEATGREWGNLDEARRLERQTCPARGVSWYDAAAYCNWRSEREGLMPCYRGEGDDIECDFTAAGYRLPTEAEWERAARGTDGREWPWGNKREWDETKCNTFELGLGDTTPVGIFPDGASPVGCLDMAGNVFEWCGDWYAEDYYEHSPRRNPTGPVEGSGRVVRGGSFYIDRDNARGAYRFRDLPGDNWDNYGFRVVVLPIA